MASLASSAVSLSSPWHLSSIRNALPSTSSIKLRPVSNFHGLRSVRKEEPKCFASSFFGFDSLINSVESVTTGLSRTIKPIKVFAMRHGKRIARLNRPPDQRKALIRGLVSQLLLHGGIKTTLPRAKAIRKFADRMITLAKDGSLHKRRQALGFLYSKMLVHAMFEEAPKRYANRNGGYTRVKRIKNRKGDNAPMAVIFLSD